jgi:hypothetical protein
MGSDLYLLTYLYLAGDHSKRAGGSAEEVIHHSWANADPGSHAIGMHLVSQQQLHLSFCYGLQCFFFCLDSCWASEYQEFTGHSKRPGGSAEAVMAWPVC